MEHTEPPQEPLPLMASLKEKFRGWVRSIMALDDTVSSSTFGRIFRLRGSGHVSELLQSRRTLLCSLELTVLSLPSPRKSQLPHFSQRSGRE